MASNFQHGAEQEISGSLRKPAIGFDATARDTDIDTFVTAITRAQQRESHVLVVAEASETRLLSQVPSRGVTVVELDDTQTDPIQELCATAKQLGFPGVLLHPDPGADIRYAVSYERFLQTDKYLVPARVTQESTTTDLIAGIQAQSTSHGTTTESLVARTRSHADQVVVVADEGDDASHVQRYPEVSVIDTAPTDQQSAIQTLLNHVDQQYADYDAFVCLIGDAEGQDVPAQLAALDDAITDHDADLAVGHRPTDDESSESLPQRVKERVVDELSLGTADRAGTDTATDVYRGVYALSPAAVSHFAIREGDYDSAPSLVDAAIRADLDVTTTPLDAAAMSTPGLPSGLLARDDGDTRGQQPQSPGPASDEIEDGAASVEEFILGADSEQRPVLSVVIPTMNEEEGIGTCLDWVYDAVAELRVPTEIIVSDSSTDRTPEIAHNYGAIVVEPDAPGYGYAYRYAFERVRGEYIVMGDADTTYDFSEIPRLVDHLEKTGADIVMGSRLEGEIRPGSMPALHKYIGNPLLTRFLNTFYDAGVSDAHSGFRVFTREVLEELELTSDGMEFASEMIMEASVRGFTIEELPITYHERVGEETLDSFQDGWRHVRFMLVNAPGSLFFVPALTLFGIGVLTLLLSTLRVTVGNLTFSVHTTIAGSLLTIVGYQIGTLGMFSATAGEPIKRPPDYITRWIIDTVRLEHGLIVGAPLLAVGGLYAAGMVGRWLATGRLPLLVPNLLAFTAIVVGLLTIFNAFFFSVLANKSAY